MKQGEVLDILKTGANVLLTGEPGSGKTHTVNGYVAWLRSCGIEPSITASTGIAATHIGGMTIHAWSGIGVKRDLTKYDTDRIGQNPRVARRIALASVLIIDEISMLSARILSMVDAVCKEVRRSEAPFGGLQVVLVGDFFQLPPVSRPEEERGEEGLFEDGGRSERFAFESPAWERLNPLVCYLGEQHRQEDGPFLEILAAIRTGSFAESHKAILRTRYSPKAREGVTELYSHNADVNAVNDIELDRLPEEPHIFQMESQGPERAVETLRRGCLSPSTLVLKEGAKVMFTKNDLEHRYVNGTLGVVEALEEGSGYPIVRTRAGRAIVAEPDEWRIEDGGRVIARIRQVPLRLAWAMTVHKSQGMSLDAAHMDLSQVFEYGQGYVALSRVRTLSGLSLAGLSPRATEVHPQVRAKDEEFRARSEEARERFARMPRDELSAMHERFVRACGGKIGIGRKKQKEKISTLDATLALLSQKLSLEEMARERGISVGTIVAHLEKLAILGRLDHARDLAHIERPEGFEEMAAALIASRLPDGTTSLSPARLALGERYSYDDLRLARLFLSAEKH